MRINNREDYKKISVVPNNSCVGRIEELLKSKNASYKHDYSLEVKQHILALELMKTPALDVVLEVSHGEIFGIIDAVKTKIHDSCSKVEEQGLVREKTNLTSQTQPNALIINNFHGPTAIAAMGNVSNQGNINLSQTNEAPSNGKIFSFFKNLVLKLCGWVKTFFS
ncbi:MAG: hypothetical protein K2Q34_04110 [Alphaproteobacteria bacterium]|nr:hypothetical protein [Alphaproteobacteria bacterium]